MRKFAILLLVIFLVALTTAACGGDEPTPMPEPPIATPVPAAAALPAPVGDAANGEAIFNQTCIACHGAGGVGVQGLGKPFTTSEFLLTQNDEQLLEFLKVGRASDDPLNTTGVLMPPKGGNPALTDQQLLDVIAYVRTLHE
jgi:disulfide bond formation protein DsbB